MDMMRKWRQNFLPNKLFFKPATFVKKQDYAVD